MGRGTPITDTQIERIKQTYAETGNLTAAAKSAGVGKATASKYVNSSDEFEQLRTEKRLATIGNIADELAEVRQLYVNHLKKPEVIATANAKDAATVVGIVTDKHQLVTGNATERTEHVDANAVRNDLTRRLDDLSARRAARLDRGTDGATG